MTFEVEYWKGSLYGSENRSTIQWTYETKEEFFVKMILENFHFDKSTSNPDFFRFKDENYDGMQKEYDEWYSSLSEEKKAEYYTKA